MTDELALDAITSQALLYAAVDMHVFPVHADSKAPMPGYGWAMLASNKSTEVAIDFTNAIVLWGHDNVSIAWALGLDDCMAVDIDAQPEPPWVSEVEPDAAVNITRRGRHLIFRNPPGVIPGNGVSGFPTKGGFDVRGAGGYVVVFGPDRPGFDPGQLANAHPYPVPDHLTPYGGYTTAATADEVREFDARHRESRGSQYLNWLTTAIETQWSPGNAGDAQSGRHPLACEWLAKVAEESQLGLYPFRDGVMIVRDWWKSVVPQDRWGREWNGMLSWAVGRALSKQNPPTDETGEDESHGLLDDNTVPQLVLERIDWSEFWTENSTIAEWLIEGFWPLGKRIGVYAEAGQGKSEWALWCAACIVTGHNPTTGERLGPERTVLYLDYEMDGDDLRDRLESFGLGGRDLPNLNYNQLPTISGVDTAGGRKAILDAVKYLGAEAVIIDTYGMAIEGPENEADTVHAVLRDLGNPLKALGVGLWIVHHAGKNKEQGGRGSSALAGQVDVMWMLERVIGTNETVLSCTGRGRKRRQSWVPDRLRLRRIETVDGTVSYDKVAELSEMVMNATITALVCELESAGIGWELTQRETITALGRSPKTTNLAAAMRYRRDFYTRYPQGKIEGIKPSDNNVPDQG